MGIDTVLEQPEFKPWPKIARLNRDMVITEKIDGTNACVVITHDEETDAYGVYAQSRKRQITPDNDNAGFARWVLDHGQELIELGAGYHYGEWWGQGIQRNYGLDEKRFSLFNVGRWREHRDPGEPEDKRPVAPDCCYVVPVLDRYSFDQNRIATCLEQLRTGGSVAAPGFMDPEGIVVFHTHARTSFKVTLDNDEKPKGQVN